MTINLDTLRKTAEAATPGPWDLYSTQDYEVFCAANFTDSNYDPPAVTYGSDRSEDAEFIAKHLADYIKEQERATAEARERAELEAEALELLNARLAATGSIRRITKETVEPAALNEWIAVVHKAREIMAKR